MFEKGYGKYTFETLCRENTNIELEDGRHTVFVNATGVTDDQKLQEFLNYLKDGTVSNSPFIRKLDQEVRNHSSNAKWREEYNMLLAREELLREEGVQKGIRQMVLNALKSNSIERVAEILLLPIEEVQNIAKTAK